MKRFIYKFILKPKHERTEPTIDDTVVTSAICGITTIIVTMIICHYAVEMFKFDRISRISDTCRTKYVIADFDESNEYLCESYLFDGTYYILNDENSHGSNIYIHRRYNITDDGITDAMYNNPLKYTAQ